MTVRTLCLTVLLAACSTTSLNAQRGGTPTIVRPNTPAPTTAASHDTSGRVQAQLDALADLVATLSARVDSLQQVNSQLRSQLQGVQSGLSQQYNQLQTLSTAYQGHTHTFPEVTYAGAGLWPEDARPALSGTGRFLIVRTPSSSSRINLGGPVPAN